MTINVFDNIISTEQIEIYGNEIQDDPIGAGYNIGDLLNMPSLGGFWNAIPHNTKLDLNRMYQIGLSYKGSILNYYIEARPHMEIVPYELRVLGATDKYIQNSDNSDLLKYIEIVKATDVLCVHIRCGDKDTENGYLDIIEYYLQFYREVYIFSGLHLDQRFVCNAKKKTNFQEVMNRLLVNTKVHLIVAEPDHHIALMRSASNLLIHKGGFSAIGAIVCAGNIFVTSYMDVINHIWRCKIKRNFITWFIPE